MCRSSILRIPKRMVGSSVQRVFGLDFCSVIGFFVYRILVLRVFLWVGFPSLMGFLFLMSFGFYCNCFVRLGFFARNVFFCFCGEFCFCAENSFFFMGNFLFLVGIWYLFLQVAWLGVSFITRIFVAVSDLVNCWYL